MNISKRKRDDIKQISNDKKKIKDNNNELETDIRNFISRKIKLEDLQSQFQVKFLPMGYIQDDLSLQIKRLRLQVIFLKLIAETNDDEELKTIEIICSMIEQDIPEWSGIHKSPFIEVMNEKQYVKIADENIEEAKYLFNKCFKLTKKIYNKYKIPNIFNKNDTEKITKGFIDKKHTYFISYTHLLELIRRIRRIKDLKSKSSSGGKLKIIKVIKKY